jgi:pSer/pThr/pTyr-binding forkhead associated (FHA) protein
MATVSFQVIDGVDKGRAFEGLAMPVTIGREEGNVIRLNDERVSRFHAKIQEDHGHIVLTDLDSTNGSTVNGEPVQLRILKAGDQITIGRSKLVFGTPAQIAASAKVSTSTSGAAANAPTVLSGEIPAAIAAAVHETATEEIDSRGYPKLPSRLAPSQAAQLSEAIDFLHRALADATEVVHIPANAAEARLPLASWQQIQAVLAILARYSREVAEPADATRS